MWRNEDLIKVLIDSAYQFAGAAAARPRPKVGRDRQGRRSTPGPTRMHLPASPLMHGTGAFTSFQAMLRRHGHRHAREPPLRRARAVADRATRARHADGDRRRRVRQADGARARRGRGEGQAVRHLLAAAHHQLGRDVVDRDQAGAHEPRATSSASTRSGRARASGSRARSACPVREPKTAKFTIGERTRRCSPTTAARSSPAPTRSACSRSAATSRSATTRTRRKSDGDVPRDQRRRAGRSPATSPASKPTARSCCSAGARRASTPAARRSTPKRSRRR